MMTKGMEMMVQSLIKMVGLDPLKVQAQIEDIRKSLHTFAANSEIVRRQNSAIMAHLGIAEPTGDDSNGENRQLEHGGEHRSDQAHG